MSIIEGLLDRFLLLFLNYLRFHIKNPLSSLLQKLSLHSIFWIEYKRGLSDLLNLLLPYLNLFLTFLLLLFSLQSHSQLLTKS